MVNISCPHCDYSTGEYTEAVALEVFRAHQTAHANAAPGAQSRRTPKVDRPPLKDNITEETWNAFIQSWEIFVKGNGVTTDADLAVQLYSCCDMSLKAKLTAVHQNILSEKIDDILALLKSMTVTPVAKTVKRNELLQMQQDAGETIRTYLSRVKGKAVTCGLRKECTHVHGAGANGQVPQHVYVDYTDEWIRHVILNGLHDDEIRRDIFGQSNLDTMNLDDLNHHD